MKDLDKGVDIMLYISNKEQVSIFERFSQDIALDIPIKTRSYGGCGLHIQGNVDPALSIEYNLDNPLSDKNNEVAMLKVGFDSQAMLFMSLLHELAHYRQVQKYGLKWVLKKDAEKDKLDHSSNSLYDDYRQLPLEKVADRYARRYYKKILAKYSPYII